MLRRVHGGAIPVDAEWRVSIPTLAAPFTDESTAAGRVWAELPRSGTVLIGSGPLAIALAHAVMAEPPAVTGLTVVTNSLDAAVHLARLPQLSVYNIGGTVSHDTGAQEGDWALEELARLRVDVAVLNPAGISADHGLSETTPAAAAVAQAILACSERRLAICTSGSLGRNAFVRFGGIDDIHHVFVAGSPDENVVRSLIDKGLAVTVVAVPAHDGEPAPSSRTHAGRQPRLKGTYRQPPLRNQKGQPEGWPFCCVVRRRPSLPHGPPCSTIGAERLNFRVRNGAGCFPLAVITETLWRYKRKRYRGNL